MSQNFATKCGSLESLKSRVRCGFKSLARQRRCTVFLERPTARAIVRVDQRARFFGGRTTSVIARRALAGSIVAGRPGRGASSKPASPKSRNRWRQRPTVVGLTWRVCEMRVFSMPCAASRTMRTRRTSFCGDAGALSRRWSSCFCAGSRTRSSLGRAMPHHGMDSLVTPVFSGTLH